MQFNIQKLSKEGRLIPQSNTDLNHHDSLQLWRCSFVQWIYYDDEDQGPARAVNLEKHKLASF